MYICLCQGITDQQIRQAVQEDAVRMRDLRTQLGVTSECGKCACAVNQLRKQALQELKLPLISCPFG